MTDMAFTLEEADEIERRERARQDAAFNATIAALASQAATPRDVAAPTAYRPPPEAIGRLAEARPHMPAEPGTPAAIRERSNVIPRLAAVATAPAITSGRPTTTRMAGKGGPGDPNKSDAELEAAREAAAGSDLRARIGAAMMHLANRPERAAQLRARADERDPVRALQARRERAADPTRRAAEMQLADAQAARDPASDINRRFRELMGRTGIDVPADLTVQTPGWEQVAASFQRSQAAEAQARREAEQYARERADSMEDWRTREGVEHQNRIALSDHEREARLARALAVGGNAGAALRMSGEQVGGMGAPQTPIEGAQVALRAQADLAFPGDTPEDTRLRDSAYAVIGQIQEATRRGDADGQRVLRDQLNRMLDRGQSSFSGAAREYGKEREQRGLTTGWTAIRQVEDALERAGVGEGGDIPGQGLTGALSGAVPGGHLLLSQAGRDVQRAVRQLLDVRLRAATGAAAPPSEQQTFAQIIGASSLDTDTDLRRALAQARDFLDTQESYLRAGYNEEALRFYDQNLQRETAGSRRRSGGVSRERETERRAPSQQASPPRSGTITVRHRETGQTRTYPDTPEARQRARGNRALEIVEGEGGE